MIWRHVRVCAVVFDTEASHGVCSGNREVRDWDVDNAVDCLMRAEPFAARLFVRRRGDDDEPLVHGRSSEFYIRPPRYNARAYTVTRSPLFFALP
jgi:hypothetical protein